MIEVMHVVDHVDHVHVHDHDHEHDHVDHVLVWLFRNEVIFP